MNTREYMARRCVCGLTRGEHIHIHEHHASGQKFLRVLPATGASLCAGYLDEIELELGGCPLTNTRLGPLVREQLDGLASEERAKKGPPS